jgi:hypothetical protein
MAPEESETETKPALAPEDQSVTVLVKLTADLQSQLTDAQKQLQAAITERNMALEGQQTSNQLLDEQKAALQAQIECYKAKTALVKKILDGLQNTLLGQHWRTSVIGYAMAAWSAFLPAFQAGRLPTKIELIQALPWIVVGRAVGDGTKMLPHAGGTLPAASSSAETGSTGTN